MISFISLASSSLGNAYLVTSEGHKPLLVDCGLPFSQLRQKCWEIGVATSDLAGCVISHGHLDHCRAVARLMEAGVDCYATREAWQEMGFSGHRAKTFLEPQPPVELALTFMQGWKVVPFCAVHDRSTVGFLIEHLVDKGSLLYLTDTCYSPYRFDGLTHICIEANHSEQALREGAMSGRIDTGRYARVAGSHMSIERVLDFLDACDTSKVEEIHLLHLSDSNADAAEFKRQVEAKTGKLVMVAPR